MPQTSIHPIIDTNFAHWCLCSASTQCALSKASLYHNYAICIYCRMRILIKIFIGCVEICIKIEYICIHLEFFGWRCFALCVPEIKKPRVEFSNLKSSQSPWADNRAIKQGMRIFCALCKRMHCIQSGRFPSIVLFLYFSSMCACIQFETYIYV